MQNISSISSESLSNNYHLGGKNPNYINATIVHLLVAGVDNIFTIDRDLIYFTLKFTIPEEVGCCD